MTKIPVGFTLAMFGTTHFKEIINRNIDSVCYLFQDKDRVEESRLAKSCLNTFVCFFDLWPSQVVDSISMDLDEHGITSLYDNLRSYYDSSRNNLAQVAAQVEETRKKIPVLKEFHWEAVYFRTLDAYAQRDTSVAQATLAVEGYAIQVCKKLDDSAADIRAEHPKYFAMGDAFRTRH